MIAASFVRASQRQGAAMKAVTQAFPWTHLPKLEFTVEQMALVQVNGLPRARHMFTVQPRIGVDDFSCQRLEGRDVHPAYRRVDGHFPVPLNDCIVKTERELHPSPGQEYRTQMKPTAPIVSTAPDVMGGTPVFSGTRVPVQTLVDYLGAGESIDDFLEGFPSVSRSQVIAFLEQATDHFVASAS